MISVCMATYNGEKYIREQLDSILENISQDDELIISDDGSQDGTLEILKSYSERYNNIVLTNGPGKGVIKNFENAIKQSKGDYIFLSDQDDIWEKEKVGTVLSCFTNAKCLVVVHDASLIDGEGHPIGDSFFSFRNSRVGFVKNFVRNSYIGCCMAFSKDIKDFILPIPDHVEMHDWWIGLLAECRHGSVFIPDKLIRYRRHDKNVSGLHHHPINRMFKMRLYIMAKVIERNLTKR